MKTLITTLAVLLSVITGFAQTYNRGNYFTKKEYIPVPLPVYSVVKDNLPHPVYDENPDFIKCYWKAWELAFKNFYEPQAGSGFVSQYIDAAFNNYIFSFDTGFMTLFCNYAHSYVPGISSLDNFYARQYPDGEISRSIIRTTGECPPEGINREKRDLFSRQGADWTSQPEGYYPVQYVGREIPKPEPNLTLDVLDHPIMAWAELESYRITGDTLRLEQVYLPLVKYYEAFQKYLRQGNGLYMTDWGSMDNSPRNQHILGGGCGIDISSEMVLFARNLAEIASIIHKEHDARRYTCEAESLSKLINQYMWDKDKKFYYDITVGNQKAPVKTIAAFWPMLAGVASKEQCQYLIDQLNNPATFKRIHRVPTLAADETDFKPKGYYWQGAVWAPTNTMVVKGLEKNGYSNEARAIALNHLENVVNVFTQTGTIWENYAPDVVSQGDVSKSNFVGWSGIAPILYLIEYAIGIKADAPNNTIIWNIQSHKKVGIEKFWFNNTTVDLTCEEVDSDGVRKVTIKSDKNFLLKIASETKSKEIRVIAGKLVEYNL